MLEAPWGWWCVVDRGVRHQVKRLVVNGHSRLSSQSHEHRSETWVVVRGQATVELDGGIAVVDAGGRVFVRRGQRHRLSNETEEVLVVIEVQYGEYLGEDDIVRYEDDYGRS